MGKFLFWALVIFGILLVTRMLTHYTAQRQVKREQAKAPKAAPLSQPEEMVSCAHCHIFLPKSEALKQGEHFFCGAEHAKAGIKVPKDAS
jgi:uncharacterized protein